MAHAIIGKLQPGLLRECYRRARRLRASRRSRLKVGKARHGWGCQPGHVKFQPHSALISSDLPVFPPSTLLPIFLPLALLPFLSCVKSLIHRTPVNTSQSFSANGLSASHHLLSISPHWPFSAYPHWPPLLRHEWSRRLALRLGDGSEAGLVVMPCLLLSIIEGFLERKKDELLSRGYAALTMFIKEGHFTASFLPRVGQGPC